MDVIILGRKIGTASGWDAVGDHSLCFYDFLGIPGLAVANGEHLDVDYDLGLVGDADGVETDIIELVKEIAREPR